MLDWEEADLERQTRSVPALAGTERVHPAASLAASRLHKRTTWWQQQNTSSAREWQPNGARRIRADVGCFNLPPAPDVPVAPLHPLPPVSRDLVETIAAEPVPTERFLPLALMGRQSKQPYRTLWLSTPL